MKRLTAASRGGPQGPCTRACCQSRTQMAGPASPLFLISSTVYREYTAVCKLDRSRPIQNCPCAPQGEEEKDPLSRCSSRSPVLQRPRQLPACPHGTGENVSGTVQKDVLHRASFRPFPLAGKDMPPFFPEDTMLARRELLKGLCVAGALMLGSLCVPAQAQPPRDGRPGPDRRPPAPHKPPKPAPPRPHKPEPRKPEPPRPHKPAPRKPEPPRPGRPGPDHRPPR